MVRTSGNLIASTSLARAISSKHPVYEHSGCIARKEVETLRDSDSCTVRTDRRLAS